MNRYENLKEIENKILTHQGYIELCESIEENVLDYFRNEETLKPITTHEFISKFKTEASIRIDSYQDVKNILALDVYNKDFEYISNDDKDIIVNLQKSIKNANNIKEVLEIAKSHKIKNSIQNNLQAYTAFKSECSRILFDYECNQYIKQQEIQNNLSNLKKPNFIQNIIKSQSYKEYSNCKSKYNDFLEKSEEYNKVFNFVKDEKQKEVIEILNKLPIDNKIGDNLNFIVSRDDFDYNLSIQKINELCYQIKPTHKDKIDFNINAKNLILNKSLEWTMSEDSLELEFNKSLSKINNDVSEIFRNENIEQLMKQVRIKTNLERNSDKWSNYIENNLKLNSFIANNIIPASLGLTIAGLNYLSGHFQTPEVQQLQHLSTQFIETAIIATNTAFNKNADSNLSILDFHALTDIFKLSSKFDKNKYELTNEVCLDKQKYKFQNKTNIDVDFLTN